MSKVLDSETPAMGDKSAKQPHPTDPKRWADGTQRPEVAGVAMKSGRWAKRANLPEGQLEAIGDLDEFRAQLEQDQGGREEMTVVTAGYVARLSEAEALCRLLGWDLRERGVFTARGRVRSTFGAYLQAVATWNTVARQLGKNRRQRGVDPLDLSPAEYAAHSDHQQGEKNDGHKPAEDGQTLEKQ